MFTEFLKISPDAVLPMKATSGSAGYDLTALETCEIIGGEGSVLVPTGIAIKIPLGYYARIAPRSGLALKQHIAVNAGVIDSDYYPNPIGVILYCTKNGHSYTVSKGDRFAQIIIEAIAPAIPFMKDPNQKVFEHFMNKFSNDHAGFGSTGK